MRRQLTAEKLCVAAGHKDFQISTQQSVHKKIPAIHILDFIKEEIRYIRAIQLVYTGKYCVQIFRLDISKAVIVKIDIGISHATLLKDLVAQGGFAATPDTDDNLCEITVPLEIRLFLSGDQFAGLIVPISSRCSARTCNTIFSLTIIYLNIVAKMVLFRYLNKFTVANSDISK